MYSTILWATDGATDEVHALEEAVRLLDPDGRLVAFHARQLFVGSHVGGTPIYPDETDRVARLEQLVVELCDHGIDAELWIESTTHGPARTIAAAASEIEADAIVCGARMHHALLRFLEGSVSSKLIHATRVPVVVVPTLVAAPTS
jgi:nucleotide-binding universal stress UspA family protein